MEGWKEEMEGEGRGERGGSVEQNLFRILANVLWGSKICMGSLRKC